MVAQESSDEIILRNLLFYICSDDKELLSSEEIDSTVAHPSL